MGFDFSNQGQLKNNRTKIFAITFLVVLFTLLAFILNDVVNKNVTLITMASIVLLIIILIPLSLFIADLYLYEGE